MAALHAPEDLVTWALERACRSGRDNAGFDLACQLRDNRVEDARRYLMQYASAIGDCDASGRREPKGAADVERWLKSAASRPPRDPVPSLADGFANGRRARRAALDAAYRLRPRRRQADPSPDSVERFRRAIRNVTAFKGSPAELYITGRGLPADLAARCGVKYSPRWGGLGPAVVFPLRDESGRAVAAAGRAIDGKGKQTFGPRAHGVFSTPGALDSACVAIAEAPIDAMSLALAGLPALSTVGVSGFPDWLFRRLAQTVGGRSRTVLIAFDADAAGDAAADRLASALSLCRVRRLRPQGAKDWNAVLTEAGLDALRAAVDAVLADTAWEPHLGLNAPESQSDATVAILGDGERAGACQACGASVELRVYPDSGGAWAWYNCERCDDFAAVELRDTEHGAPESNPAAAAAREGAPQDRRESESALAERIRAALAGRPLPIAIRPGEAVTDVAAYAAAEARSALSNSPQHARAALERLALLGISADSTDKN